MLALTGILLFQTTLWMLHTSIPQPTQTLKMLSFPLPSFMVTVQCCRAHPMDVLVSPMLRIGRWRRNFDMTVSSSISYIETVTDSSFISRRYCTSLGALLYRNVLVTLIILVVQA